LRTLAARHGNSPRYGNAYVTSQAKIRKFAARLQINESVRLGDAKIAAVKAAKIKLPIAVVRVNRNP